MNDTEQDNKNSKNKDHEEVKEKDNNLRILRESGDVGKNQMNEK